MPEHVHLLVFPSGHPGDMSQFLQAAKEAVARKAITFLKSNAPNWLEKITVVEGRKTRHRFWQPGAGYDRNVTSTDTLRSMIVFIHANPVRRGLVSRPEEWEWSSARWFAGIRPVKLEMADSVWQNWGPETETPCPLQSLRACQPDWLLRSWSSSLGSLPRSEPDLVPDRGGSRGRFAGRGGAGESRGSVGEGVDERPAGGRIGRDRGGSHVGESGR